MLALAGINALGVAVFALVYAAAGQRLLSQGAFVAAMVTAFAAVTALWVRAEAAGGRALGPFRRLGRAVVALALTVVATPGLVLTPLFALKDAVPAEAGLEDVLRPALVLVLVSLALVAAVNAAGASIAICSALAGRLYGRGAPPR